MALTARLGGAGGVLSSACRILLFEAPVALEIT